MNITLTRDGTKTVTLNRSTNTLSVTRTTVVRQVELTRSTVVVNVFQQGTPAVELVIGELPTGSINGSNASFTALHDFVPESVEVFVSGFRLGVLDDYNTSGTRNITLYSSPLPGEKVRINYTKQL